jgi:hypothetical protein
LQLQPRRPVYKTTIDAIDELAEKIWDLEGDLPEALSLFRAVRSLAPSYQIDVPRCQIARTA